MPAQPGSLAATSWNAFAEGEYANECSIATARSKSGRMSALHELAKWT